MKAKIISILVLTLLITTTISAVGDLNIYNDSEKIQNKELQELNFKSEFQIFGFASIIPDDNYFNEQWSLHNTGQTGGTTDCDIDAPEAWDIITGNADVVIALIDSGVDYTHPDLAENIWTNEDEIADNDIDDDSNGYIDDVIGWDFYYDDNDPLDNNGHGTHCAGIIAAETNNSIGIAGVCWNCKIMCLKKSPAGLGVPPDINACVKAIKYAADNGADIISMSFGIDYFNQSLRDSVNYAYDKGVFLVASAGNGNTDGKHYPAAFDKVLAVAGTDCNDNRMSYYYEEFGVWVISNYGDWVDVAAPGQEIYSTFPTYQCAYNAYGFPQNYAYLSGTSMAAPHVAGLAALLLSKNPGYSLDNLKTLICENVDPYDSTYDLGTGRINAYKALSNNPPENPSITGQTHGTAGTEYTYTFNTVDPEEDEVFYFIKWGDGYTELWEGPYASGANVNINHTYTKEGTFTIEAKARDTFNEESSWGSLTVTMPRDKSISSSPLLRFLERYPLLQTLLMRLGLQ